MTRRQTAAEMILEKAGRTATPSSNGHASRPATPPKPKALPPRIEAYTAPPLDTLPPPLDTYISEAAVALGCNPAFVMLPVLSVVAALVGNSRVIQLKRGWREPSVMWSAVIGDSGTLKTPAYVLAVGPVHRLQQRLTREFKAKLAQHRKDAEEYEEKKRAAKNNGSDPGDPPEKPIQHRVICSDVTVEKLAEILQSNPRGVLLARDELAGWLGSFSRYKGKAGGSDLPNWLEMFRAGTITVDRKTSEPKTLYIPHSAVSVCGGIQPGVLAKNLTDDFLDAGGAARLLLALPPKLAKRWTDSEIHPDTESAYETLLDYLLSLESAKDKDGENRPVVLTLSPEAKRAWVHFYDEWAKEQAVSEGEFAAALSKLEAYAARFALLHHVVACAYRREDDHREIAVESIVAGVKLCRWFASEARRIYSMLGESDEQRDARRLTEFIHSCGGRVTSRQLQRSNSRKYRSVDDAEAALNALVESGAAAWKEGETPPRGGHRQRFIELCPTHDTSDTRFFNGHDAGEQPSDTRADTRQELCVFPGENERVSEVSCVGHEQRDATVAPPSNRVSDGCKGECRTEADMTDPFGDLTPY